MKTTRDQSGRFWSLSLLSFALVVISPETILAHGGPPEALGLVAAGTDGPTVALLNEGLGLKRPEAWSYMCPSLWGEINQTSGKYPIARSADGITSWVIGEQDLYVLRDDILTAQNRPELGRNNALGLANDAQDVYALHFTGAGMGKMGTDVMRVRDQPEPALWSSDDYWSAITASSDGVHLARVAGDKQLEVVTIDKAGKEQNRAMANLEITPLEIQLHTVPGRLYVTTNDGNMWLFGYFEGTVWKQVLTSPVVVLGPQASPDGTLWISIAGALQRMQGDTPQPVEDSRFITCLEQWNDWRYACVGGDLYKLTDMGLGDMAFAMDGFHGPDPKLVPADMTDNCEQQWVLYTVDAVRSGITFVDWPAPTSDGAAGAAGSSMGAAGAAGSMSGSQATAGVGSSMAVAGAAGMASPAPAKSSGGCSAFGAPRSDRSSLLLAFAVIGMALVLRYRRPRLQSRL